MMDDPLLLSLHQSVDTESICVMATARDWPMTGQRRRHSQNKTRFWAHEMQKRLKNKKRISRPRSKIFTDDFLTEFMRNSELIRLIPFINVLMKIISRKIPRNSFYFQLLFSLNFLQKHQ